MARMMDDASRAAMLNALLSQQGSDAQDAGAVPPRNDMMPMQADNPRNPAREDEQQMINQRMGTGAGDPSQAGPEEMVPVPKSMVNAVMASLMQQASGGRALGADGAGNNMRVPGDLEGAEVEADEDVGHNRGPDFPTEEMDKQRATKQIRKRMGRD